jgi:hypothetical protein
MIFYFNAPPKEFGIKTHFKEKTFGHYIKRGSKRTDINPTCFNKKNISLKNLDQLKKKLNIERIYMFDRILGLNKNILIADHINRSGVSFLRGETPYKKKPMFPDLSKIYICDKEQGVVVQTLGPKKFKNPPNEPGVVFSESAAIFATLWHYIGVEVVCFGIGQPNQTKTILELI